ncbi:baseplate J/gp47 family protein [Psychromonas ossibalaenae]|uniref:baseplate J/gp47 family protein n=1 Tax=Psychromonas ossibalaenae TaxID=444922 RepID=UPI00036F0B7B|nr:baseplate J/gp47 family protein [Psychromonas ossibalaenae]
MNQRPDADFEQILNEAGIPTSAEALAEKLQTEVVDAGCHLSNDSQMSPFWSWVRAAVVTPAVWLVRGLLAGFVLPNMFVATAARWALELKAWELNVSVKEAEKTQGNITFTKANADDAVTIVQGAIIQTLPIDGVIYQVQVLSDTVVDAGQLTGEVLTQAVEAGSAYNLPAGYFNIIPVELPGIIAAVNEADWITRLGANAETDEALALRLQNAFTSAGSWHIDDAYRSIIASVAGIRSDHVFFLNTGDITPGSAIAYILMEVGETPQATLDELNQHIMNDGHHGHGDIMICEAIPDKYHEVTATVVLVENLTEQETIIQLTEVEQRIRAAFRETEGFTDMTRTLPLSRFSLSQMGREIHNAMAPVTSILFIVDGEVQQDIISALEQPRLSTLSVSEEM